MHCRYEGTGYEGTTVVLAFRMFHVEHLTHSRSHALTHSRTHALTHSRTHALTHSRTHALTHSRTHLRRDRVRGGVAPQALELVELARLRMEDVEDEVEVVDQDPASLTLALHVDRADALLLHLLGHVVGDGAHVRV